MIEAEPCAPEVIAAMLRARLGTDKTDTMGGLQTVDELLGRGRCFVVREDGHVVGGYVLQDRGGREVFVLAGAGAALRGDLTAAIASIVEQQAEGFQSIALQTRRRGLVRKLAHRGYQIDGYILRKKLK